MSEAHDQGYLGIPGARLETVETRSGRAAYIRAGSCSGQAGLWVKHDNDRLFTPPGRADTNLLKSIHRSRTFYVTADFMRRAVESSAEVLGSVESAYLLPRLGEIGAPILVLVGRARTAVPRGAARVR